MRQLILEEATYFKEIKETVIPYLKERKTELQLEREPGKKLYCARYLVEDAVGVVVISHGFTETEEKYQENIYYFLKKHYHVYMAEHCGHGYSYRLEEDLSLVHVDSYKRYADDLLFVARRAAREQEGLPLFLYGHSMGGGVAAAALAMQPELFDKAILSSPMIRPLTGGVPWTLAKLIASAMCLLGKSEHYVPGHHAYDGKERFEDSASICRERFDLYQERRDAEPLYQMSAASCGWFHEAAKLNSYLRKTAWKHIKTPLLIFQASDDTLVSAKEQERFAAKVRSAGKTSAKIVYVPNTKHEIFNSSSDTLRKYWKMVFDFFAN